jgi:DNA polymerase-3 subunit epsilon
VILIDVEGTDLITDTIRPLSQQPRLVELGMLKCLDDDRLTITSEVHWLFDPGIPLPKQFSKITGITPSMVSGKPTFPAKFNELVDFFLGERLLVAHNLAYDHGMLEFEIARIDRTTAFPWPPAQKCTVELSQYFTGKYLKLTELYRELYGQDPPEQEHRALADAYLLHACAIKLRERGML